VNETVAQIRSEQLGNERPLWIVAPVKPTATSQLVLFLDGEHYWERIGAPATITALGADANHWFVFVSMLSPDSRWTELPCNPRYAAFIVEEVLPWLNVRFPLASEVSKRTLIGASYSGLAAAYIVKQYPGVFDQVIAQSGSFWSEEGRLAREYRALPKPIPTTFYLEVGTRETQENLQHRPGVWQKTSQMEAVKDFRDALQASGHRVRYVEFDGAHEFSPWQKSLPAALRWALGE
jgi:enterochelin esterase-like enzyme